MRYSSAATDCPACPDRSPRSGPRLSFRPVSCICYGPRCAMRPTPTAARWPKRYVRSTPRPPKKPSNWHLRSSGPDGRPNRRGQWPFGIEHGAEFTPFLAFPVEIRRIVYTTNAIESLNYQLRKVTKARGSFPSDAAAIKLLYLAIRNINRKRGNQGQATHGWTAALNTFTIQFPDRLPLLTPTNNEKA